MKPTQITSELGRLWNSIKETKKATKYKQLAEEDKTRYLNEVPETKESGDETKKKKLPKNKSDGEETKKKAKTGYNLFRQEKVSEVSKRFSTLSKKEIQKKLSEMWSELKTTNPEIVQDYNVRAKNLDSSDDEKPVVQVEEESEQEAEQGEQEAKREEDQEAEQEIDPGLASSQKFLEYLNEIKQSMKKGNKIEKQTFIDGVDENNLPDELIEELNTFTESKAKTMTIRTLELLIKNTGEVIASFN